MFGGQSVQHLGQELGNQYGLVQLCVQEVFVAMTIMAYEVRI